MNPETTPVIVGVGEITDRPADPVNGLEPLALMEQALTRADADACGGLLQRLDSLDVVCLVSWRYADTPRQLCARLGIAPARAAYGVVGGETPIKFIHEAAQRIARGESRIAAICGAEAQHTAAKAAQLRLTLPWTPFAEDAPAPKRGQDFVNPLAAALGISRPITIYPLYETASSAAWGQTPRQAQEETGELWAALSRTAADNPHAWQARAFAPDDIVEPAPDNRLIAWPYTKRMVANPTVNMGAAILITSLAEARRAGVPADRIVNVVGGAHAVEPRDYLARDQYASSHAQTTVLEAAAALAAAPFDAVELYSCFPCVPKMARRTLGLPRDCRISETGGLPYFGAPLNNYMGHAACAMVRRLRASPGTGLLYGQGEFVTKHHAVVLASEQAGRALADKDVQKESARRRGPVPALATDASGAAEVETSTVIYDRNGAPTHGAVILRTGDGRRSLARVPARDERTLAVLTDLDSSPVGAGGDLSRAADGTLEWTTRPPSPALREKVSRGA